MLDDYYTTLLCYHNGIGVAKLHGNAVQFGKAPDLGSGPVHRLEYRPEIGERQVGMLNHRDMRIMTDEEVCAADALLVRLTQPQECHYSDIWKDGRC